MESLPGALGWLIPVPFMNDWVFGILYLGIAGVMAFMSFDELLLLPRNAEITAFYLRTVSGHQVIMAISLLMPTHGCRRITAHTIVPDKPMNLPG